ncbi:TPA: hypothetical protein OBS79_000641 [Escherichia coli]|nr:hypothetical protein [Escherichia coli]
MNDSLNSKELVAAGHEFAKTLSSDTAIIDIAKMVSRLAERLDCTAAALHATQAQRDQLGVENAALKSNLMFWDAEDPEAPYDNPGEIAEAYSLNYNEEFVVQVAAKMPNRTYRVCESWEHECKVELAEGGDVKTPATDAFLAELKVQGIAQFAAEMGAIHAKCQAGGYFDRQVQVYGKAQELAESYLKQLSQEAAQ